MTNQVYIVQQLIEGEWQPIASASDERGVIENIIDLHNDSYYDPGRVRLTLWTKGEGMRVIYESDDNIS